MAMVVKNNMSAVNTLNTLNKNQSLLGKSLQKVSSGMKINSAQDDASGYAISERMRVMIRSLDQANQNTQNGSSLMKVAEGAVSNTVEILKTLKEKAINAATDTNTEEDRAIIQKEIDQLVDQIDDNALITFNGKYLLDGSKSAAGVATYNAWTNQSLAENTSALTKLTELQARGGEKLTIESTDKVTVSYVQNGKTYTTTAAVSEVKTFGGIFKLAEKIDENSTTFATSANESVAEAGGLISAATNKDNVDKAVAYLQDVLSFNTSESPGNADGVSGIATEPSAYLKVNVATANGAGDLASATLVTTTTFGDLNDPLFSLALESSTGMSTTYNGELFAAVKETYDNYNTIVNKMGDATKGMGYLLKTQLNDELGITWDGKEGTIKNYQSDIYEKGSDQLIKYYEDYTSASASKNDAQKAMNAAIKDYNEGLAQLDALVKLQKLETEKSNYNSAVDSFISALRTEMSGKQEGTYTLAAGTAGNAKDLSFEAGNSQLSDADRSAAIDAITTALKDKLYSLADEAMLNLDKLPDDDSIFLEKVKALIGDSKQAAATAGITYTKDSAVLGLAAGAVDSTNGSSLIESIAGYVATMKVAADPVKTARAYLELAQNNVLEEYAGPAILTGSNVGLDPAGKIVTTLDGSKGLTFTAANSGADGQISGFTISISDSDGNVRKSVNTSLNAWSTTIYGKNASEKDNSLAFQIGASANQTITVDMADMRAEALGLKGKDGKVVDVSTKENANAAISVFENALQKALDVQTTVGAIEARLEYTASNLTTSTENVQAAESTIRDADMAKEMTNYTKNNVLLQAAQSMLAQANQNSSAVLSLLQ